MKTIVSTQLHNTILIAFTVFITGIALILISCDSTPEEIEAEYYQADLNPLNSDITGYEPEGTVKIIIEGDSLIVSVFASNLPPGIVHFQHLHAYTDGSEAVCPTMVQDTTGDGVIDLLETELVSGKTILPFHGNPANLELPALTYPVADSMGTYSYKEIIHKADLQKSLKEKFGIEKIDFIKSVVFIHGVDTTLELPRTTQSLPGVPAHVTIPIACGKLIAVDKESY